MFDVKKTVSIKTYTPMGRIPEGGLDLIAEVIRKFGIPKASFTSGQRLLLSGIPPEQEEEVRLALGEMGYFSASYVQACPGKSCKYALQDCSPTADRLEEIVRSMELPAKVKSGVSACPRCCAESKVRDIGLIGLKKGWTVHFGGNAGHNPRVGDELATTLTEKEALELIQTSLKYYANNARPRQRTARFMEKTGIEALKKFFDRSI